MQLQRGNVLLTTSLFSLCLMGFAALAIDVGMNTQTRTRLQAVADAAALAGGQCLQQGENKAVQAAVDFAALNGIDLSPASVTFPDSGTVRVSWTQPLTSSFASLFGIASFQVPVKAEASLGSLVSTSRLRPWGIPYQDFQTYEFNTAYLLKMTSASDGYTGGGSYYPIALDGGGGNVYRHAIIEGSDRVYSVGDTVPTERGNMKGPTLSGLNQLIANDPYTSYQAMREAGASSSPRIVIVPLIDGDSIGKGKDLTIVKFGTFFITDWRDTGEVIGQFIRYTHTLGTSDGAFSADGTHTLRLIN